MKLMDIDSDTLGIPDTDYDASVTMQSSEFSRIVRDMSLLGESVRIEVSKEGVRFSSDGEAANGNVLLKQTDAARAKYADYGKEKEEEDDETKAEDEGEDEDGKEKKAKVKKEKVKKEESGADVEMEGDDDGEGEFKPKSDDEGEDENPDDDDEGSSKKKRRKAPAKNGKPAKKARRSKADDDDDDIPHGGVRIEMNNSVSLTFSLKYLVNFSKSTPLSDTLQLMMSNDVPLLVRSPSLSLPNDQLTSAYRSHTVSTLVSSDTTWHRKSETIS